MMALTSCQPCSQGVYAPLSSPPSWHTVPRGLGACMGVTRIAACHQIRLWRSPLCTRARHSVRQGAGAGEELDEVVRVDELAHGDMAQLCR